MDCRAAAQYVLAAPSQKFHFVDALNHNVHGYSKDIDGVATYVWVYQEPIAFGAAPGLTDGPLLAKLLTGSTSCEGEGAL